VRNNVGDLEVATRVSHFELSLMRQCRECRFDRPWQLLNAGENLEVALKIGPIFCAGDLRTGRRGQERKEPPCSAASGTTR